MGCGSSMATPNARSVPQVVCGHDVETIPHSINKGSGAGDGNGAWHQPATKSNCANVTPNRIIDSDSERFVAGLVHFDMDSFTPTAQSLSKSGKWRHTLNSFPADPLDGSELRLLPLNESTCSLGMQTASVSASMAKQHGSSSHHHWNDDDDDIVCFRTALLTRSNLAALQRELEE